MTTTRSQKQQKQRDREKRRALLRKELDDIVRHNGYDEKIEKQLSSRKKPQGQDGARRKAEVKKRKVPKKSKHLPDFKTIIEKARVEYEIEWKQMEAELEAKNEWQIRELKRRKKDPPGRSP